MKEIYSMWDHQKRAVDFAMQHKDCALFYQTGTGKTSCAINILRRRFNEKKRYMSTLILAPIAILRQFKSEFPKFSRMDENKVHAVTDTGKKRVERIESILKFDRNQIIIINYEALLNKEIFAMMQEWQPELLICDEIHLARNYKTKRFKATKALSDKAEHTVIMTGSPIANSTMDVFGEYAIMDGGETFGKNFFVFRNKYFRDANAAWSGRANHFPKYVPRTEMEAEMNNLIYTKAIVAKKEECIELPDLVSKESRVDLKGDQLKAYKEMERDFITFIKSKHDQPKAVVAQLAVTKASKMSQITSGFLYDEEKVPHYFKSNPKLDELKGILEQVIQDDKVIIWCNYKAEITMINKLLTDMGIKFVSIDGSVSARGKGESQNLFAEDDSVRAIVGNRAMATGLNLQQGAYSIYFSRNYSYITNDQAQGRNWRGNSIDFHDKITEIDIITNDSIDERVLEALSSKEKISDVVLNWRLK